MQKLESYVNVTCPCVTDRAETNGHMLQLQMYTLLSRADLLFESLTPLAHTKEQFLLRPAL